MHKEEQGSKQVERRIRQNQDRNQNKHRVTVGITMQIGIHNRKKWGPNGRICRCRTETELCILIHVMSSSLDHHSFAVWVSTGKPQEEGYNCRDTLFSTLCSLSLLIHFIRSSLFTLHLQPSAWIHFHFGVFTLCSFLGLHVHLSPEAYHQMKRKMKKVIHTEVTLG